MSPPLSEEVQYGSARPESWRMRGLLVAAFGAMVVALVVAATWANSDLTLGRPFLFMDEAIPFDNVRAILTAPDAERFVWAVRDGADHRYGRIFYNVSALFAAVPFRIWDDPGLIVAIRCTQVLLLVSAYVLLCLRFLQHWPTRLLAFAALACLPYSSYYLTQPKPEPLQLLFIVLFLAFGIRRDFRFGWPWLFLGLAFGTKISTAPLCLAAGLVALYQGFRTGAGWRQLLLAGVGSFLCFLLGWLIAVPLLLVPNAANVKSYLDWTFRFTGHGLDDSRVNALSWVSSMLGGDVIKHYLGPKMAGMVAATATVLVAFGLRLARPGSPRHFASAGGRPWILLAFGASLLLPIIFTVHRLWGFYLHPGQTLVVVGLAALGEQLWSRRTDPGLAARWARIAALAAAGVTVVACAQAMPRALREYAALSRRTEEASFARNFAVYEDVLGLLRRVEALSGGPTVANWVAYDPVLFVPPSRPGIDVRVFWGAFKGWEENPALVVLSRLYQYDSLSGEQPLPPPTSAKYEDFTSSAAIFSNKVSRDPANPEGRAYVVLADLHQTAVVLARADLADALRKTSP